MLDDFRQQASSSFEDENLAIEPNPPERHFLGLSPAQRFVIALLLLFMIFLIGTFFLLVTGRVVPPFL